MVAAIPFVLGEQNSVSLPGIGAFMVPIAIMLVISLFIIASMWKVFTKAGKPGWASIVPIYNAIVMCEIAGKPAWWVLLLCIPFVNIVFAILIFIEFARAFGKGAGFGLGLAFFGIIFFPVLAFGSAQYVGPSASAQGFPVGPR